MKIEDIIEGEMYQIEYKENEYWNGKIVIAIKKLTISQSIDMLDKLAPRGNLSWNDLPEEERYRLKDHVYCFVQVDAITLQIDAKLLKPF